MASTHLVRAIGYLGVLAIALPLIGLAIVYGWATGRMGANWWFSWGCYAVAASLFGAMVWLLARIRATAFEVADESDGDKE